MEYKKKESCFLQSLCVICNTNLQECKGMLKDGRKRYRATCSNCKYKVNESKRYPYRKYKKDKCEYCGFIPIHFCQLDVDHIDGNHHNNNKNNLQTLCANCHRLKTQLNKDYSYKLKNLSEEDK